RHCGCGDNDARGSPENVRAGKQGDASARAGGVQQSERNDVVPAEPAACREKNLDRKSTRLNSSHVAISYAVFCLKKKKNKTKQLLDPQKKYTLQDLLYIVRANAAAPTR